MGRRKQEAACEFEPFSLAGDVCVKCGQLQDSHPGAQASYSPFKEAMWKVLIKEGGIHDYYGGYDPHNTDMLRAHFGLLPELPNKRRYYINSYYDELAEEFNADPCSIDWRKTREPDMGTVAEFDGTDCESAQVPAIEGHLYCMCGEYDGGWASKVVLLNKTVGQLIWLATKAGEIDGSDSKSDS